MKTERPVREILDDIQTLVRELATRAEVPKTYYTPSNQKKLTRREVDRIRELKRNGMKVTEIADVFDVHRSTVTRIINRTYWK